MSARGDIENTFHRWALAYDENDLDTMAECFTDDAVLTIRIGDGDLVGPFEGKEAVMGLMRDSLASQTDQRRHITTNIIIRSEDATSATTESYLTLMAVENGAIRVLSSGKYQDELVNQGGVWRLSKRHIALDLPY
ncbi:nuclear transport factor 2 family protein [Spirillospora sp. NPDC048819]|uniref:nuclear transport factor 2 family protein n=1 Tax=Spirillospora sp. NPDC048819 TaxID=3155268 RepID=UPI0033C75BE1